MQRRRLEWLLEELCTQHGLCISPIAREQILADRPASAGALIAAVFRAERLEPPEHPKLYRSALASASEAYAAQSRAV